MATDPTKPNPKGHWLKELLLDLTPVLGEVRSGRQAMTDFEQGKTGWGMLNLAGMLPLVGTVRKLSKAAKLARAAEIVKEIKAAGGITLDLRTGEKVAEGFSAAIPVKGFKPSKELTPEMVLEVLDKAPEGTHLGAWQSGGKWFLEPAEVFPTIEQAAQAGVDRGQIAVGDLARYAQGQPGDILILRHRTKAPLKAGDALDPKFMGTGMVGAEKARPGRPGAIHFYGMKGKVEDMFQGVPEVFSFAHAADFLDLGSDEARALMRKAGGDADKLERLAIKAGYRGVAEAVDETVKSPYARVYKVFGKSPVLQKGKPATVVPEAFKEATAAVETKALKREAAKAPAVATLSPKASALMEHARPSEVAPFTKGNLERVNELVHTPGAIPEEGVMEAAAREGAEAVGGYRANADIIARRMGAEGPMFARLVAALSPKHPWKTGGREPNVDAALDFYREWVGRGRPAVTPADVADMRQAIHARRAAEGLPMTNSMETHFNNIARALNQTPGPLSGPKANSFGLNLSGDLDPGTLDTRMAQAFGWSEDALGGMTRKVGGQPLLVAGPEYAVMNAVLGRTGRNVGLPRAETQEAIWHSVGKSGLGAAERQPEQLRNATAKPFAGILGESPIIRAPELGAPDTQRLLAFLEQLRRSGAQQFPF